MNVLLVEDDVDLAGNIADYLDACGHQVDCAFRASGAETLAAELKPDIMILDLTLPDGDGLNLAQTIRSGMSGDLPILMLTARDTEADRLRGFESGADDYLLKPFSLAELEARLNVIVLRATGARLARYVRVADVEFDRTNLTLRRDGIPVRLKPAALKVLDKLMAHTPNTVPSDVLRKTIWVDEQPDSDLLKVYIHTIRKAIDAGRDQPLLHTVRGVGYRIAE